MTITIAQGAAGAATGHAGSAAAKKQGPDSHAFHDLLADRHAGDKTAEIAEAANGKDSGRQAETADEQDEPSRDKLPLLVSLQHLSDKAQGRQAKAAGKDDAAGTAASEAAAAGAALAIAVAGATPAGTSETPPGKGDFLSASREKSREAAIGLQSIAADGQDRDAGLPATAGKAGETKLPAAPPADEAAHTAGQIQSGRSMTIGGAPGFDGRPATARNAPAQSPDAAEPGVDDDGSISDADAPSGMRDKGRIDMREARDPGAASATKRDDAEAGRQRAGGNVRDEARSPVVVTASQSFAAPASHPLSQTAAGLVAAIAADNGYRQAPPAAAALAMGTAGVAVPAHVLRIELHPSELGSVTASLRLAGQQLSVELKPETHEAYRRLTADSDDIVRSLKRLGLDVGSVTVMQPQMATTAAAQTDASSSATAAPNRDPASFQPGSSRGDGNGASGRQANTQSGGTHDGGPKDGARNMPASRVGSGGNLYI